MKRFIAIALSVVCAVSVLIPLVSLSAETAVDTSWYSQYAGTEADPFILSDTKDLEGLAKLVNGGTDEFEGKYIKLSWDFDNTTPLKTIIGNRSNTGSGDMADFHGHFDGNGQTVKIDIDVNSASGNIYAGMFGMIIDAQIKSLNVTGTVDVNVTKKLFVGGLAGFLDGDSSIEASSSSVTISSQTTANNAYVAALVGNLAGNSTIVDSFTTGSVTSSATTKTAMAAGIAASTSETASIINCYSTGSLSATSTSGPCNAAGLVSINAGKIYNSYSISSISGSGSTARKAGLVGQNQSGASISDCFSTYGTLVYTQSGTINGCYVIDADKKVGETGSKISLLNKLNNNAVSKDVALWKSVVGVNAGYPVLILPRYAAVYLDGNEAEVKCHTLQEAINSCPQNGCLEISLLGNVTENIEITGGRRIAIKMNGYAISADAATLASNGSATIHAVSGSLYLSNGFIKNTGSAGDAIGIKAECDVTITDCNIIVSATGSAEGIHISNSATATINTTAITSSATVINNDKAVVKIQSGSFIGEFVNSGTFTISNGLFSKKPSNSLLASKAKCALNVSKDTKAKYPYQVVTRQWDTEWYLSWTTEGTEEDPYILHNMAELEGFARLVNGGVTFENKYIQLADDFEATTALTSVIGNGNVFKDDPYNADFRGHFDGKNKEITLDLFYDTNDLTIVAGMFGRLKNAEIKNVVVSGDIDIDTTYKIYCGGIAAYAVNSTITNCCSNVNISAITTTQHAYCAGLVGDLTAGSILSDSYSNGNISATVSTKTAMAGGVAADSEGAGAIYNCYSNGDMTATSTSGTAIAAGIITINQGTVVNCYSTGSYSAVGATQYAAGLVGNNTKNGTVQYSYSVCSTLVGNNKGTSTENYAIDSDKNVGESGAKVSLLYALNANADVFDCSSWQIKDGQNNGYPIHRFPKYAASIDFGSDVIKKYRTLQQAIDACPTGSPTNATTIILLADLIECVKIKSTQNIVIDLNGKTLTAETSLDSANHYATVFCDNAKVEITNGTIVNHFHVTDMTIKPCAIYVIKNKVKVNQVSIDILTGSADIETKSYGVYNENAQVEISGSSFLCDYFAVYNESGSSNISSGTYRGKIVKENGTITISGGVFNSKPETAFLGASSKIEFNADKTTRKQYPYAVLSVTLSTSWYTKYAGTEADPYILSNTADLEGLAKLVNTGKDEFAGKYFKLASNFNNTTALTTVIGNRWEVSGGDTADFRGNFDGNGQTVKIDLDYAYATGTIYVGVFGMAVDSQIKNLTVEGTIDINVTKKIYVGGLAGYLDGASSVKKCQTNVTIKSTTTTNHSYAGGIVGHVAGTSLVEDSYSKGSVDSTVTTNTAMAGGVAASTGKNAIIRNSFSTGNMKATATTGIANAAGIVSINQGLVSNCYAVGTNTVSGDSTLNGGIVGENRSSAKVDYCFSINETFVANDNGTSTNCLTIDSQQRVGKEGQKSLLHTFLNYYARANGLSRWRTNGLFNGGYPFVGDLYYAQVNYGTDTNPDIVKYYSLQEAIDAIAQKNLTTATTIVLLNSLEECVSISDSQNIILDLNSKILYAAAAFESDQYYATIYVSDGKLSVKNGTIKNTISTVGEDTPFAIAVEDDGQLVSVDNVTINVKNTSTEAASYAAGIMTVGSKTTISDTTISATATGYSDGIINVDGRYVLNNVTISASEYAVVNHIGSTTVNSGKYIGDVVSSNNGLTILGGLYAAVPDEQYLPTYYKPVMNMDGATNATYGYQIVKVVTDTSWYTGAEADGTYENPYLLHDTADIEGLAKLVNEGNDFSGKFIKLADDFDGAVALKSVIGNGQWLESDTESMDFKGCFDGNKKEVKLDLCYDSNSGTFYAGMFGRVVDGEIMNLTVSGTININTTKKIYSGGIGCYVITSNISNCGSHVSINAKTTNQHAYCGGLVGNLNGESIISDSYSDGNISATVSNKTAMAAGISAVIEGEGTIVNCYTRGNMTAKSASGTAIAAGIIAINEGTVVNCYSTGSYTATGATEYEAGLVGTNSKGSIVKGCYCIFSTLISNNKGTLKDNYTIDASQNVGPADKKTSLLNALNEYSSTNYYFEWKIQSGVNNGYPIHVAKPKVAYLNVGTGENLVRHYFSSVQDAFDYCIAQTVSNPVITLICDTTESIKVEEKLYFTLDLNNKTLTGDTSAEGYYYAVLEVGNNCEMNVKNGTLRIAYSGTKRAAVYGIWGRGVNNGSTIENVTIEAVNNSTVSDNSVSGIRAEYSDLALQSTTISVSSTGAAAGLEVVERSSCVISDATITSSDTAICLYTGSIDLYSGRYIGSISSGRGNFDIYGGLFDQMLYKDVLAEDYACVDNTDPETKDTYPKMVILPDIVQIGEGESAVTYKSLDSALADAELLASDENPIEIKVIFDFGIKKNYVIAEGKNISFNLNGHTISSKSEYKKVRSNAKSITLLDRLNVVRSDMNVIVPESGLDFKAAIDFVFDYLGEEMDKETYVVYSVGENYQCVHCPEDNWWEGEVYNKTLSELTALADECEVYVIGDAWTHEHNWSYAQGQYANTIVATCENDYCTMDGGSFTIKLRVLSPQYYDGTIHEASYGKTVEGISYPEIIYYVDKDCTIKTTSANSGAYEEGSAPVNPGSYYIKTAYLDSVCIQAAFTIERAEFTIQGIALETSRAYDGTTNIRVLNKGRLVGVVKGDDVSIDTVVAEVLDKNVGDKKEVVLSYTLKGKDKDKYTLVVPDGFKASITKKQLSVENTIINNKAYDGTNIATVGEAGSLRGVVKGDDVAFVVKSAEFVDKNVGDNKTVNVVYEMSGKDSNNYDLVLNNTLSANVTRIALSVNGTQIECKKKGSDYVFTVVGKGALEGVLSGDEVKIDEVKASFANEEDQEAGMVTVEYVLSGKDAQNYMLASNRIEVEMQKDNLVWILVGGGATATAGLAFVLLRKKRKASQK